MATRFGFGQKTGESEKGGLAKYENGHVDVSGSALRHAIEQYPEQPPKNAIASMLAGGSLFDSLAGRNDVDYAALQDDITGIQGVGESTAEKIVAVVRGHVDGDTGGGE